MAKATLELRLELDKEKMNNGLIKKGEVKEVIDICNKGIEKYKLEANKIDVAIDEYSDKIVASITLKATGSNESILKLSDELATLAMENEIKETQGEMKELLNENGKTNINRFDEVKAEISEIDNKIKLITERPFKSEEDELEREKAVNELMDERDELVVERIKMENEINEKIHKAKVE